MNKTSAWILLLLICAWVSAPATAADFRMKVVDLQGNPVEDAVIELKGDAPPPSGESNEVFQIVQKDKAFTPAVTVVPVGGRVEFPNRDSVQHHVYSFSEAKKFDIPLYKDQVPPPLRMDTPGVIILGCNIHDWMKAYIYVARSPHVGRSGKDGMVTISGVPAGSWAPELWHPRLRRIAGPALPATVALDDAKPFSGQVSVDLKRAQGKSHIPSVEAGGYR